MKRIALTSIFAVSLFLISQTLTAQNQEFVIEVMVDTEQLNHDNIYTDGMITLQDDSSSATGKKMKGFKSEFKPGTDLKWVGVSKNNEDIVEILTIERKWFPFTRNLIKVLPERKQDLVAKTIDRKGRQRYCIIFKVTRGNDTKEYEIDPKLRSRARI